MHLSLANSMNPEKKSWKAVERCSDIKTRKSKACQEAASATEMNSGLLCHLAMAGGGGGQIANVCSRSFVHCNIAAEKNVRACLKIMAFHVKHGFMKDIM